MVSVSSQFLKQMFASAGYGISLSPGTLKRKQNPSLLVGKIELAYRAKQIHQPVASEPILLLLCYSRVKKCVCLEENETTDKHFRCLRSERLRCDEEVVSKTQATKWVGGWDHSSLTYLVQQQGGNHLLDVLLALWTGPSYSWSGAACYLLGCSLSILTEGLGSVYSGKTYCLLPVAFFSLFLLYIADIGKMPIQC